MSRHKHRQPKPKTIPDVLPSAPPKPPPTFTARSKQQASIFAAYRGNDLLILTGPPDSSKTFSACLLAWWDVMAGTKDRIVVYRPAVSADEDLGFAPGTYAEKLAPWVEPVMESFAKIAGKDNRELKHILECKSLGQARGLTFENAVVIITEAQNCTLRQLKLILTRMGQNTKYILEGDEKQIDLKPGESGFVYTAKKLSNLKGVAVMNLESEPSGTPHCRHPLVAKIAAIL